MCAEARSALPACVRLRPVRWVSAVLLGGICWWLLLSRGFGADGAVLGVLGAGGWGLGLVPVHADLGLTGPQRRTGESGPVAYVPVNPVNQVESAPGVSGVVEDATPTPE